MPEKIFTIPIHEAMDRQDGCPFCHLREKLEQQTLAYTLGGAMMEPSVRIEMNRLGFCPAHYAELSRGKNRLSLALILESHLDALAETLAPEPSGGKRGLFSKQAAGVDAAELLLRQTDSCFICDRIRSTERRYASNAAWLWESEPAFREKLSSQPQLCLRHGGLLLAAAKAELKAASYEALYQAATALMKANLSALRQDITDFARSFDHRSAGKPLTEAQRSAVERSIQYLK